MRFPCCFKLCMFLTRVSHSKASCYGVSKWKLLICHSRGLCRTSQDNLMMTWLLGDEMTLKTTLLVWEPMVTSNGLVSWVNSLDEKFWPSMTSGGIGVFFSTKANLYCHTNSLSRKHVDAPYSRNVWASITTNLLHLKMISTKKHGAGSEDKLGPFSFHDAPRFCLVVLIETKHAHFPIPLVMDW